MIVWFAEEAAQELEITGGKGANLSIMTHAGLPVPPGFCVTAQAYQRVLAEGGLEERIQTLLDAAPRDDQAALQRAAASVRQLVERAPMPPRLEALIAEAWGELGADCVAVRSSATAEDLPEASFAGQQDTYLGVTGERALLQAVRACWASLWTYRAITYRERRGFEHHRVSLAVVVQSMVAAEVAGVLFTANPLNGARDEMLVSGSWGLGESVVSGHVTPDSFVLGDETVATIGSKKSRWDLLPGGGITEVPVAQADRDRSCLEADELAQLRAMGIKVQAHYGAPQDIEWAFSGGSLYLLQTRPITALAPAPVPPGRPLSAGEHRVVDDILEHYPDPPFPLDYESVVDSYQQLVDTGAELGVSLPSADQIIAMDARGVPRVVATSVRVTLGIWRLPLAVLAMLRVDPGGWRAPLGAVEAELAVLEAQPLDELSDAALAELIAGATALATRIGGLRFSRYVAPLILRAGVLKGLLRLAGEPGSVTPADLLADLRYKTAEINEAMEALAEEARLEPQVRRVLVETPPERALAELRAEPRAEGFLLALEGFLSRYGARTMKVYLPFSNRSWSEEPEGLIATLAVMLRAPSDALGRSSQVREKFQRLEARVKKKLWPLGGVFERVLARYREGHVAREATLFGIERCYAEARRGMGEASTRLAARGLLRDTSHARYLRMTELLEALTGEGEAGLLQRIEERVAARPVAHSSWLGSAGPSERCEDGVIVGLSGSPGLATGPARLIAGPGEFCKLRAGDVLVCSFTDPAWTPLFSMASAVVADTGGPLSHAAIVARESQIPAVLGAQGATQSFEDGQLITVDGSAGRVWAV